MVFLQFHLGEFSVREILGSRVVFLKFHLGEFSVREILRSRVVFLKFQLERIPAHSSTSKNQLFSFSKDFFSIFALLFRSEEMDSFAPEIPPVTVERMVMLAKWRL